MKKVRLRLDLPTEAVVSQCSITIVITVNLFQFEYLLCRCVYPVFSKMPPIAAAAKHLMTGLESICASGPFSIGREGKKTFLLIHWPIPIDILTFHGLDITTITLSAMLCWMCMYEQPYIERCAYFVMDSAKRAGPLSTLVYGIEPIFT